MNKKVLFLSTLALAGGLFLSCSEAPSNETSVETTGDLHVYARDGGTGGILPGATVTLLSVDKNPKKVDANGNLVYANLPIGNYSLRIDAPGYATVICNTKINYSIADNIAVTENTFLQASLFKLGASVEGYIYYNDPQTTDIKRMPATGAELELRLIDNTCSFEKKEFPVIVGTDGTYKIDSLPEKSDYTLYAFSGELGGVKFEGFDVMGPANTTGIVGSTTSMYENIYQQLANKVTFEIVAMPYEVGETDKITIGFSKPVSVEKIMGSITVDYLGKSVAITTSWSSDKKSLTIVPANGKWEAGRKYKVTLPEIMSAETVNDRIPGDTYYVNITIADLSAKTVTGLSYTDSTNSIINAFGLDSTSTNVKIEWKKLAGAINGYEIYAKKKDETAYTWIAATGKIDDTTMAITGKNIGNALCRSDIIRGAPDSDAPNYECLLGNGVDSVNIVVAGKNDKGISKVSDTLVIKKKDPATTTQVKGLSLTETYTNFGIRETERIIGLKWEKIPGAVAYDIYAKRVDATDYTLIASSEAGNPINSIDTADIFVLEGYYYSNYYNRNVEIGKTYGITWFDRDSVYFVVKARSTTGTSLASAPIRIKAIDAIGGVRSASIGLKNSGDQLLINQANGSSNNMTHVAIKWEAVAGATSYRIYATSSTSGVTTTYSTNSNLNPSEAFYDEIETSAINFSGGATVTIKITAMRNGVETNMPQTPMYTIKAN
jgi:hypothetical protein